MIATPAPAVPHAPLSRAEREQMLASVENLFTERCHKFRVPQRDWEDAMQDLRLLGWELTLTFDPTRGAKWSTYIRTAINHTLARRVSAAKAEAALIGELPADDILAARNPDPAALAAANIDGPPPEDDPLVSELLTAVRRGLSAKLLDRLGTGLRRLVELVAIDGFTPAQVAEQLGQPVKATKTNLQMAVRLIRGERPQSKNNGRTGHLSATVATRRKWVAKLRAEGKSAREIAARIGCTAKVVYTNLKALAA